MPGMWFDESPNGDWKTAQRHLRADPVMKGLIRQVGPCTLRPRDYFVKLAQSIYSQQISTTVAAVLFNRLATGSHGGGRRLKGVMRLLAEADDATIKSIGLSRQKKAYLHDLADTFRHRKGQHPAFCKDGRRGDRAVLIPIKGIGRWTVEMFLIFCLNRTDVYPIDDLGVRKGTPEAACLGGDAGQVRGT